MWGILGMIKYGSSENANKRIVMLWQSSLVMLCLVFSFVAARQNAYDVYWIETEMVGTAKWVQENIPADALLAVHDIGAIGYFDQHKIVDLAGLASPEVVAFIRDQDRISTYLDERGVDYLVTLPSFYPQIIPQLELVYPENGRCGVASNEENMCVFRWK
jgi:hypothetical protein